MAQDGVVPATPGHGVAEVTGASSNLGHFGEPFFLEQPAGLDDPFPDLARYLKDCPVYYNPSLKQWFVFRYEDVAALFADNRLSADRMKGFVDQAPPDVRGDLRQIAPLFQTWVMMMDGANHSRIRHVLNLGFNSDAVQRLTPAIERAVAELLQTIGPGGTFDAASDYAFLLPARVLSDLFGVQPEDRHKILQWSLNFIDFFNIFPITTDTARRMIDSTREMEAYTLRLIAERRDRPRDDFLGVLVAAGQAPGGMSDEEIAGNAMLILIAGHIAVRNLIGNVLYLLFTYPEQKRLLDSEPERLSDCIEETLRFEPPVTLIPRVALEDIVLGDVVIPAGAVVQLSIAAANRDPQQYPAPERFDITRKPGRVLSFGRGAHGCLGFHLARLQSRIALQALLTRAPRLRPDPARAVTWYRTAANRGPIHLPVLCD
jgi:cytochrome P450